MKNFKSTLQEMPRVSRLYLARQFFSALYFSWPVWYGFASQRLSASQVGVYFSVLYISQLIFEVPTGAFADKFGRRKAAVVGALLMPFMPLILYFGHNFISYLLAAVLYGISLAFLSGSLDSLLYDDHKINPALFRKINIYEVTFFQSGLITSAAVGGFLYAANPVLPFLFEALAAVLSLITILLMKEVKSTAQVAPIQSGKYFTYLRDGFKYLLATKQLWYFVGSYLLLAVAVTASIEFVNEATMIRYAIDPQWRGIVISGTKVVNLVLLNFIIYKLLQSDRAKMLFLTLTSIATFGLFIVPSIAVFLPAYIMFNWISASRTAFFHPILHERIPSSHRATTMSSLSALVGITSFVFYPAAGYVIQRFHDPLAAYVLFFGMVVASGLLLRKSRLVTMKESS